MSNPIEYSRLIMKRTQIAGLTPSIATSSTIDNTWLDTDILTGELYYNIEDKKLYTRSYDDIVLLAEGTTGSVPDIYSISATLSSTDLIIERNDGVTFSCDLSSLSDAPTLEEVLINGNVAGTNWIEFPKPYGLKSTSTSYNDTIAFNAGSIRITSQTAIADQSSYLDIGYSGVNLTADGTIYVNANSNFIIDGSGTFSGVEYKEDYSANYTNRSLVDKEYVDGTVTTAGVFVTGSGTGAVRNLGDNTNVASGSYAFAMGQNNVSSGSFANIFGFGNTASGSYNSVNGRSNNATGDFVFIYGDINTGGTNTHTLGDGNNNTAQYGITVGINNTTSNIYGSSVGSTIINSGQYNFVSGRQHNNASNYTGVFGRENTASDSYGFVAGYLNTVGKSYVFGYNNVVNTPVIYSFAGGTNHTITSNYSASLGDNNSVSGVYGMAFGRTNVVSSINGMAMGRQNTVSGPYSLGVGYLNTVSGAYSVSTGLNNNVSGDNSAIIGGNGLSLTQSSTVLVPALKINTVPSGTPVNNLGIDASGNVIIGTSGGSGATPSLSDVLLVGNATDGSNIVLGDDKITSGFGDPHSIFFSEGTINLWNDFTANREGRLFLNNGPSVSYLYNRQYDGASYSEGKLAFNNSTTKLNVSNTEGAEAYISQDLSDGNPRQTLLVNDTIGKTSQIFMEANGYINIYGDDLTNSTDISIEPTSGFVVTTTHGKGIEYATDYSSTFTNRSLVDKEYVMGGSNAKVENFMYSFNAGVDNFDFFDDGNVRFGWDAPGNDLEFYMDVEPAGATDLRSLATLNYGTQQNTAITTTSTLYDLYGAGVAGGNQLNVIISAYEDAAYPMYMVDMYNTGTFITIKITKTTII